MTDGKKPETPKFEYLLNALERCTQFPVPAHHGYAGHRAKVLDYVAKLETDLIAAQKELALVTEMHWFLAQVHSEDYRKFEKAEQALALRGEPVAEKYRLKWLAAQEFAASIMNYLEPWDANTRKAMNELGAQYNKNLKAVDAALPTAISGERAGWQTVPREANEDMIEAAYTCYDEHEGYRPATVYRSMLDAAPNHPAAVSGERVREATEKETRVVDIDYAIALQRAIYHHCLGQRVPERIAEKCPHHARMLNIALPLTAIKGDTNE